MVCGLCADSDKGEKSTANHGYGGTALLGFILAKKILSLFMMMAMGAINGNFVSNIKNSSPEEPGEWFSWRRIFLFAYVSC